MTSFRSLIWVESKKAHVVRPCTLMYNTSFIKGSHLLYELAIICPIIHVPVCPPPVSVLAIVMTCSTLSLELVKSRTKSVNLF